MVEGPLEATWLRCDVTVHESGSGAHPAAEHHRKKLLNCYWLKGGVKEETENKDLAGEDSGNSRMKFEKGL